MIRGSEEGDLTSLASTGDFYSSHAKVIQPADERSSPRSTTHRAAVKRTGELFKNCTFATV